VQAVTEAVFTEPSTPEELDQLEASLDAWLAEHLAANPAVEDVARDRGDDERRWFVRMAGEQKRNISVWLVLRQRNLHFECSLMPAPEENQGQLYEHLLRRNARLGGLSFAIGAEDGIYLIGQLPNHTVTEAEVDRMLGSVYEYVELSFRPAMRIGYASRFEAPPSAP
jgi:hypothetical protein